MKKIKRNIKESMFLTLLPFIVIASLTTIPSVKAYDNRIFFDPSKPTVEVSNTFRVDIAIEVTNFRNLNFSISWNPNFVNCTGIVEGSFLDIHQVFKPGVINNTIGTAEGFFCSWTLGTGKNGIGCIAIARFIVLKVGGTPLQFIEVEGKDANGDPMTYTIEGGYATLVQTLSQHIVWTDPDTGDVHGFDITTVSNSTVGTVNFDQPNLSINFTVEGPLDTVGVCNVTIPRSILECPDDIENWMIFLNSTNISDNCTMMRDDDYTYIHIPYTHSIQTVTVRGTWVIPEFSTITLMMTLITMALITTATIKLIHRKRNQEQSFIGLDFEEPLNKAE